MLKLVSCSHCNGFLKATDTSCPHCERATGIGGAAGRPGPGWLLGGLIALCGGAFAVTLMACYGLPPCRSGEPYCDPPDLQPPPADMLGCSDGGTDAGCAQKDGG